MLTHIDVWVKNKMNIFCFVFIEATFWNLTVLCLKLFLKVDLLILEIEYPLTSSDIYKRKKCVKSEGKALADKDTWIHIHEKTNNRD